MSEIGTIVEVPEWLFQYEMARSNKKKKRKRNWSRLLLILSKKHKSVKRKYGERDPRTKAIRKFMKGLESGKSIRESLEEGIAAVPKARNYLTNISKTARTKLMQ